MWEDVAGYPIGGGGVGLSDGKELLVGNGDSDLDSGTGEG